MAQVEHGREPCPDRILDDIGGAFGMGAVGGGIWQLYKGLRNSPKGYKISGAIEVQLQQQWQQQCAGLHDCPACSLVGPLTAEYQARVTPHRGQLCQLGPDVLHI